MKHTLYLSLLLMCAFFSLSDVAKAQNNLDTSEPSCPLIDSYIRIGYPNNTADVYKLQAYLTIVEGIDTPFNGVFDAATQNAVKVYQARHQDQILTPWGLTTPTGNVYITTKNFLNEESCGQEIPYTAEETRILNSPRTSTSVVGQGTTPRPTVAVGGQDDNVNVVVTTPTPTQTITLPNVTVVSPTATNTPADTEDDNEDLTANVTDDDEATTTGTSTAGWLQSARGSTIIIIIILAAILYFIISMLSRPKTVVNNRSADNRGNQNNPNQNRGQNNSNNQNRGQGNDRR